MAELDRLQRLLDLKEEKFKRELSDENHNSMICNYTRDFWHTRRAIVRELESMLQLAKDRKFEEIETCVRRIYVREKPCLLSEDEDRIKRMMQVYIDFISWWDEEVTEILKTEYRLREVGRITSSPKMLALTCRFLSRALELGEAEAIAEADLVKSMDKFTYDGPERLEIRTILNDTGLVEVSKMEGQYYWRLTRFGRLNVVDLNAFLQKLLSVAPGYAEQK